MLVMSQEAYNKFGPELKPNGLLLVEQDLVRVSNISAATRVFSCPATRIAEGLGKHMVLNSSDGGLLWGGLESPQCGCAPLGDCDSVPASFKELNLKAFDQGYDFGLNKLTGEPTPRQLEDVVRTLNA